MLSTSKIVIYDMSWFDIPTKGSMQRFTDSIQPTCNIKLNFSESNQTRAVEAIKTYIKANFSTDILNIITTDGIKFYKFLDGQLQKLNLQKYNNKTINVNSTLYSVRNGEADPKKSRRTIHTIDIGTADIGFESTADIIEFKPLLLEDVESSAYRNYLMGLLFEGTAVKASIFFKKNNKNTIYINTVCGVEGKAKILLDKLFNFFKKYDFNLLELHALPLVADVWKNKEFEFKDQATANVITDFIDIHKKLLYKIALRIDFDATENLSESDLNIISNGFEMQLDLNKVDYAQHDDIILSIKPTAEDFNIFQNNLTRKKKFNINSVENILSPPPPTPTASPLPSPSLLPPSPSPSPPLLPPSTPTTASPPPTPTASPPPSPSPSPSPPPSPLPSPSPPAPTNNDLNEFIDRLERLNKGMREEIYDVIKGSGETAFNPESVKKSWKKHKPFIVSNVGTTPKARVRKCALNFGAHRCVYRFLPFDKKKLFGSKEEKQRKEKKNEQVIKNELKQCKQYTKVVGVDIDFYTYVDSESLVAKTIEHAIASGNILEKNTTGRQYFCDKHLKQLMGVVPRQIDSDSLAYHLIATQPFYEGDVVATFSQIKIEPLYNPTDRDSNPLTISPVDYFKKSEIEANNELKNLGTLDDACFRDLGDYITDPNADAVFDLFALRTPDNQLSEAEFDAAIKTLFSPNDNCNVAITLREVNGNHRISLEATRPIYKGDVIHLNFGEDYWKRYIEYQKDCACYKPRRKSSLKHYKILGSYGNTAEKLEEIKDAYLSKLLNDTTANYSVMGVDSVPAKRMSLKRLSHLYKSHSLTFCN